MAEHGCYWARCDQRATHEVTWSHGEKREYCLKHTGRQMAKHGENGNITKVRPLVAK